KAELDYLSDVEISDLVGRLNRKTNDIPESIYKDTPSLAKELEIMALTDTIRDASRVHMHNFLQRTEFSAKPTQNLMNYYARHTLMAGRAKNDLTTKITGVIASAQDMALRGWNFKSAFVEFTDVTQVNSFYGVKTTSRAMMDVTQPDGMMSL